MNYKCEWCSKKIAPGQSYQPYKGRNFIYKIFTFFWGFTHFCSNRCRNQWYKSKGIK